MGRPFQSRTLAQRVSEDLLPYVQQPAQYIGGEHNQLAQPGDWDAAEIKVAIAFPDTYAIGMSHLGCQILYWLCNHTPGVCAERVYAPWLDAEQIMREKQIPLFTWDTRQDVASADILAISLQYELCFTSVLNLLDLAGIPLRAIDRVERVSNPSSVKESCNPAGNNGLETRCTNGGLETRPTNANAIANANPKSKIQNPKSDWPLVIVGGPQADNPEPMAEFVDLVVIGDGEHAMAEILEAVRAYKRAGIPRRDMILQIARRFPWVYAPNLYEVLYHTGECGRPARTDGTSAHEYRSVASSLCRSVAQRAGETDKPASPAGETPSTRAGETPSTRAGETPSTRAGETPALPGRGDFGTIAGMLPKHEGLPSRIERCKTPDFDAVPFPTRPLVPWTQVVHDRISIEIMRGCPQVCRFCHAGYTKRPLTLRTVDRILEIAEEAWRATGHHEIGLLSLSTADYPYLKDLAARFNQRFGPRHVNMSFPSLRIDKMLQHIPWMASGVRKGSITMAVEAAKDDMRAAIRKKVTDGNLLDGVREVYKAGWNRVKLYFMSGFPGERDEDIFGIWEVANAVSLERRATNKPPAEVNASVGWLVPKPFTPLQWMAQPRLEYFLEVREKLRSLGKPGYKSVNPLSAGSVGVPPAREATMRRCDEATQGNVEHPPTVAGVEHPPTVAGVEHPPTVAVINHPPAVASSPTNSENRPTESLNLQPSTFSPPTVLDGGLGGYGSARGMMERGDDADFDPKSKIQNPKFAAGRWNGKKSAVKITTHDPRRSILEGVMARGDRRLGVVILEAWKRGARLDGWDECYRHDAWQDAFTATAVDPDWYAHRERSFDEILPWDHIGLHMRRGYLEESYESMFETIRVEKPQLGVTRVLPVMA